MSQSECQAKHVKANNGVRRRQFISAGFIGGVTLALNPSLQPAFGETNFIEAVPILPSPADSLSLYMLLLDRIRADVLNPYFDLVGCLSGEVKSRYDQLRDDVAELERLVPQLRSAPYTSNLKGSTDVGIASASLLESMAEEQFVPTSPHFAMISFDPDSLNKVSAELESQSGSLTLSRRAANLLRKILAEIRDLQKPTEDLNTSSGLLTDLNNDLEGTPASNGKPARKGKLAEIRSELIAAINELIADDLSAGQPTPERQNRAKEHLETAKTQLQGLDGYTPPASLQAYIGTSHSTRCQPRSVVAGRTEPTKGLRELLTATAKWIENGGQFSRTSDRKQDDSFYVKASLRSPATPDWIARWFTARNILSELLPPATRVRTGMCLCLIGPILFAGYDAALRENLIYDQIPNMFPGGSFDHDNGRRRDAAHRLASL